ncbi:MAG: histidine triad nucleotide-binding protein [Pirellulaceae bacterium]|nr:histidine triad nucleotide-binding protein [Pirellulaceae bacterium]
MAEKNIFQRIIDGEIPAKIIYEDEHCLAFEDIKPAAPAHFLVIPKRAIASVNDVSPEDEAVVGHLFTAIRAAAAKLGLTGGYRVVANCGPDAGQDVMHLHFHVLAGRRLGWPPG